MRYSELFEQAPSERLFYHVTTPRRVKAILQTGIQPGHNRLKKGLGGKRMGERGYIYLISDYDAAVKWATNLQWQSTKHDLPLDIVCVRNIDPTSLEPDANPEGKTAWGGTWFQMKGTIGPENIVRVIPLTPELTQQVLGTEAVNSPAE